MTDRTLGSRLARGLAAGAAGTAALNVVTNLDMAIRARPASGLPEQDIQALAERAGLSLGDGASAEHRRSGAGALMGSLTGMAAGMAWTVAEPAARRLPRPIAAAAVGIAVMVATDAASAALGTTDPREWAAGDWIADLVPHLAYGSATVATYDALRR